MINNGEPHSTFAAPDTQAAANFITLDLFKTLGFTEADITDYDEEQEAINFNGEATDILGWATIEWYIAEYSHAPPFTSHFDVVDHKKKRPMYIGLTTLNKEGLLKFVPPKTKKVQKDLWVAGKRKKARKSLS